VFFSFVKLFMHGALVDVCIPQLNRSKTMVQRRLEKLKPSRFAHFIHLYFKRRGEKDRLNNTELAVNTSILVFAGSEMTVTCY
jgi:hypothetical protein